MRLAESNRHSVTSMKLRKDMQGVTLIELMIVVVIVAILASIAFPNYRAFVIKSHRNEAKAAVLKAAVNQEKWYLTNNTYTTDLTKLGFKSSPSTTDSGKYTVSVSAADTNDFTVTATYVPENEETLKCKTFTITGDGTKSSLPKTDCWTRRN